MDDFIVSSEYSGYVFVGYGYGRFKNDKGEMQDYASIFVLSPVSDFESDDFHALGYKSEKKRCLSSDVFLGEDLKPGDRLKLFFDDKQRVIMVALDQ